ncbi:MAG TPA: DpnI domain-containing protein, partial [Planctomycetota bacterium]|nr:DpnI domain-containing protein [Planctomycetota bacterium]
MNSELAAGYKAGPQIARVLTEGWFQENMYCPCCPSRRLYQTNTNTKVVDFACHNCNAEFQLKAKSGNLGRKLRDAAYEPMRERITLGRAPHFAFLSYDSSSRTVSS